MSKRKTVEINPQWTKADFRRAAHVQGASLSQAVAAIRRGRGPQKKPKKIAVSIRLEPDIVSHFKSGGAGWQVRMEKALKAASEVERKSTPA